MAARIVTPVQRSTLVDLVNQVGPGSGNGFNRFEMTFGDQWRWSQGAYPFILFIFKAINSSTIRPKSTSDDPPSPTALAAASFISLAFLLLSSASSPSPITASTAAATLSATTTVLSSGLVLFTTEPTLTPTPNTSTKNLSLNC
ncbi:hypothetical protein IEQ34_004004 [Dendrobium chrysotoxum]|uniref:Uncharacterized protein n=1 Tax=Dendrobium chrysotoxum TaxID=161865 RepID=A0AAV7HCX1_DENCH|nr:hypothetical protein IEQ34_004004 [Dendrobium chrysotoxum]